MGSPRPRASGALPRAAAQLRFASGRTDCGGWTSAVLGPHVGGRRAGASAGGAEDASKGRARVLALLRRGLGLSAKQRRQVCSAVPPFPGTLRTGKGEMKEMKFQRLCDVGPTLSKRPRASEPPSTLSRGGGQSKWHPSGVRTGSRETPSPGLGGGPSAGRIKLPWKPSCCGSRSPDPQEPRPCSPLTMVSAGRRAWQPGGLAPPSRSHLGLLESPRPHGRGLRPFSEGRMDGRRGRGAAVSTLPSHVTQHSPCHPPPAPLQSSRAAGHPMALLGSSLHSSTQHPWSSSLAPRGGRGRWRQPRRAVLPVFTA